MSENAVLDVTAGYGGTSRGALILVPSYGSPVTCAVVNVYEEQGFQGKALDAFGNMVEVSSLLVPIALN